MWHINDINNIAPHVVTFLFGRLHFIYLRCAPLSHIFIFFFFNFFAKQHNKTIYVLYTNWVDIFLCGPKLCTHNFSVLLSLLLSVWEFQTQILNGVFLEGDVNTVGKLRENYESIKNTFIFHLPPTGNRRTKFKRTHEKHENHFCGISWYVYANNNNRKIY